MEQIKIVWKELLLLFILVFLSINSISVDYSLLHNVNLIFHEAGHTIFSIFGEFTSILGGSLMQILVPFIVLLVFLKEGRILGFIFSVWWIGDNLIGIGIYASDAKLRLIPLLGGDNVIHDWWYLLSNLGLLESAQSIGQGVKVVGILAMILSIGWLLKIINDKLQNVHNLVGI